MLRKPRDWLSKRPSASLLLAALASFGLAYWLSADFRSGIGNAVSLMASGNVDRIRQYFLSFGMWAPVVSAGLIVLHSVLAPLPGFFITIANGLLFGLLRGTLLSWGASLVSAAITYWITHALGRPAVERFLSKNALGAADRIFQRYGTNAVLIARLVPVLSFDIVGYAAGLAAIPFWGYMAATAIGSLPATVVYVLLGENLSRGYWFLLVALAALALIGAAGFLLKRAVERKRQG